MMWGPYGYGGYGYDNGDWGLAFGYGIIHLLVFIFIVLLIIWALRLIFGRGRHRRWRHFDFADGSAMSILRERYAKGEISKEEFEERKAVLEK